MRRGCAAAALAAFASLVLLSLHAPANCQLYKCLILVWRLDTQLDVHVCFSLRACVALAAPHPRRLRRLHHRSGAAADAEHVSAASLLSLLTGAVVNSSQRRRRRGPCVCSGRRRLPQRARGRLWSSRANEREPAECCGHLALLSASAGLWPAARPCPRSTPLLPYRCCRPLTLLRRMSRCAGCGVFRSEVTPSHTRTPVCAGLRQARARFTAPGVS